MPLEIERKFLVASDDYKEDSKSVDIKQAYLSIGENIAVRVRIEGLQGSINIKSKKSECVNHEFEYAIPLDESRQLIRMSPYPAITKTRYIVKYKNKIWEVDEFHADNAGLVIAEIELENEDEELEIPSWLDKEVTADFRYLNSNLVRDPFNSW